ncbi:MFS family permease [Nocardioides luteus]|uniref:MFS transporter n=1 Tax=Nocardioides luteus TaxID=1844 RepID=A0ABQ5SUF6_9ACTN|nr:MFS transporter [Nocardioides luteus]MDR7309385.1 MFS family permease [Nocardioides luteus]GGR50932.1 MFS transporter [Nocardioides luteus]GLJ67792.1 MFS transporter [Nocardioides luteus]
MIRLPSEPVERPLVGAIAALSLARGMFFAVSALYFTRTIGLSAVTVGIGLTVAGGVGVLTTYAGGRLSDRWGADRVQLWSMASYGIALLAYALARDVVAFLVVATWVSASRGFQSSAQSTLIARWFEGPDRVAVRARLRVVMNVMIGAGTLLAALALAVDTAAAYRGTMVLVGLLTTVAALPLVGLRRRVAGLGRRMDAGSDPAVATGPSPLRDRTYVTATVLTGVMAIHFGVTSIGVPLWVADHTDAPTVLVSLLLVVNTVYVALFQVRASRGTHDIVTAGRAVRGAGFLLLGSCVLFAAAAQVGPAVATGVLVLAALASSAAETRGEAGSWGLAFELADPQRAGAYQGVSQMGYALAHMLAPLAVTATAIDHGTGGWLVLGSVFAVTGILTALLARHAAAARGEPQRSEYVASETPV